MKHLVDIVNESLNESASKWRLVFLQYDPDVQKDYEDGDTDELDLRDSAFETDIVKPVDFTASNDKDADKKAENIIKKEISKHPEICGGRIYDKNGDEIENIFI